MAVATINMLVTAGTPGDGSSGNAAPGFTLRTGTETNPKKQFRTADFDAATNEHLWFHFQAPQDYGSAPAVRLNWRANATSGSVSWGARVGAITAGDTDTVDEHASASPTIATTATNPTEARRLLTTTITLANLDSMAAGDEVFVLVYRDAANGSDTCAVDAELVSVSFTYTTT